MNRYDTCCRHRPALKSREDSGEFFFACSRCGAAGPPASTADKARVLWNSVADRCSVFDLRGPGKQR